MNLRTEIFGSPGYAILKLLPAELAYLNGRVKRQKEERIGSAPSLEHEVLWGDKAHRIFPKNVVDEVKQFNFLREVKYDFGQFRLTPVVHGGVIDRDREEFYWRYVRQNEPRDVGKLHADSWFHRDFKDAKGPLLRDGERTLKCWMSIQCDGANGLEVIPNSHIDANKPAVVLDTPPGTVVVFGDRLLHRGVTNMGICPRISAEITLVLLANMEAKAA